MQLRFFQGCLLRDSAVCRFLHHQHRRSYFASSLVPSSFDVAGNGCPHAVNNSQCAYFDQIIMVLQMVPGPSHTQTAGQTAAEASEAQQARPEHEACKLSSWVGHPWQLQGVVTEPSPIGAGQKRVSQNLHSFTSHSLNQAYSDFCLVLLQEQAWIPCTQPILSQYCLCTGAVPQPLQDIGHSLFRGPA